MQLKILSTPEAGNYSIPGHPENPQRVLKTLEHLKKILPTPVFAEPAAAPLETIRAVHLLAIVETVQAEGFFDPDTPGAPGIHRAALLSAGAALRAAEEGLRGTAAFSLMRPPGHHATPDRAMGFCYFNSMAVAVRDILHRGLARRIAILDLDCHHGNGTEAFCLGKPGLLYVSLHQFPAYPGTGLTSRDNCRNYPLPPSTRADTYFQALEEAMREVRDFRPDLVGLSMGFDTYVEDPLTRFGLVREDYRKIGNWMRDLQVPQFALLEGGYHGDLPVLVEEFLSGWTD